MRTVTLGQMLGAELFEWVYDQHSTGRLTDDILRKKLEEKREFLANHGVDADYAYYAVLYVLSASGRGG
jgi:hypothetical protein